MLGGDGPRVASALPALVVLLMVSPPFLAPGAAAGAGAPPPSAQSLPSQGVTWLGPHRLTNNGAPDSDPQIEIDGDGGGHIIWRRGTVGNESYYASNVSFSGGSATAPLFVSSQTYREAGGAIPLARSIVMDASGSYHLVTHNFTEILYYKYDPTGQVVVDRKVVGPLDSYGSQLPSITVGVDQTIHEAHWEERFNLIDVAYDKLGNDGSDVWIDRVVASDIAFTATSVPGIKTDPYGGNIHFLLGTNHGLYLERFNRYGVRDLQSIPLRYSGDMKEADVAADPDGNMHVAWVDGGSVFYSMVNSTGAIIVNGTVIGGGGNATGFARVAASPNGTVFFTWAQGRSGVSQVVVAAMAPGQDPTTLDPKQVSDSTAGASQPWVKVEPGGDPLLAWVDTSDGQAEVYYARGSLGRCQITADPVAVAQVFFSRPNQTYELPMAVENRASVGDDFFLWVDTSAPDGWAASVSPTSLLQIGPGETVPVNLTFSVPLDALDGQNASFGVQLSSRTGACTDEFHVTTIASASRTLSVSGQTQKFGKDGEAVTFALTVQNLGDVREENIQLSVEAGIAQWPTAVSPAQVSLDPRQSASFQATVTIPADAPGGESGIFYAIATSSADPSVHAYQLLTVQPSIAIDVVLTADPEQATILPGATVQYRINVSNVGNLATSFPVDVFVTKPAGAAQWQATVDRNRVYLKGHEWTTVVLSIQAPPQAPAGIQANFVVDGYSPNFAAEGRATVTATVVNTCMLVMNATAFPMLSPGGTGTAALTVTNAGNGDAAAEFSFSGVPTGWGASVQQIGTAVIVTDIDAFSSSSFTLALAVPQAALAGRTTFDLWASADGCGSAVVHVPVEVSTVGTVTVVAESHSIEGAPGEKVTAAFTLTSTRNEPVDVWVQIDPATGAVSAFTPLLLWETPEGGALLPPPDPVVHLDPRGTAVVTLHLDIPHTELPAQLEVALRFDIGHFDQAVVPVTLHVLRPDLEIVDVRRADGEAVAGSKVLFNVTVVNQGRATSGSGYVVMTVDGFQVLNRTLSALGPGETAFLQFPWDAAEGTHNVSFAIVVTAGPTDADHSNDGLDMPFFVARAPVVESDVPGGPMVLVAAAVGAAAAVGVGIMAWRRHRFRETRK